jgi:hypothetical protein
MQHEIALIDETLDINQAPYYHISIQSSLNGFSFCILDTVNNKYVLLKHYHIEDNLPRNIYYEKIDELVQQEEWFDLPFKSARFMHISDKVVFVPRRFFTETDIKKHFEFAHDMEELDELHYNNLAIPDACSVFSVPNYVANSLLKKLSGLQFYHHTTPMLFNAFGNHQITTPRVFINYHAHFIDIMAVEKDHMLFYNAFPYGTLSDVLYYILYVYDKTGLNMEENEIIIMGNVKKKSAHIDELAGYIKKIKFEKLTGGFVYSYTLNDIPSFRFTTLFNLYNCA